MPIVALCWLWLGAFLSAAAMAQDTVLHWTFEHGNEGHITDLGPNGLHGTATAVTFMPGEPGRGMAGGFHADGARVDVPASEALAFDSSESFTVRLRLRAERSGGFSTVLMTKDRPGGTVSYSFTIGRWPGRLSLELWSWQQVRVLSRARVDDGLWHHVVGCYDAPSNLAMLLVDGELQAALPAGKGGPGTVLMRLGDNLDAHQQFLGDVDDVLITAGIPEDASKVTETMKLWTLLQPETVAASQQAYLDRMAKPKFAKPASPDEWRAHARQVREHVLTCLGLWPLPERLPLNPHVSGVLERDGYVVKRIYWQTWPGYYASGYLYMPTETAFPAPGILCPHGHWENGAKHPTVQARLISLAKKGYVVLAVDSVHAYNWAAGLVPMTVMCWNNIRGVDLLCSLPEVDTSRLGCTGCSGGGQQTFYMMAIEDRLDVAIPVCMVSEFRRILAIDSHHCMCNHVPGILTGTDTPELAACFAPRPSLLICVTQDWTAWLPQEGFPEIRGVYGAFGRDSDVRCTQYDWQHDYSKPMREEAYGWFNRYLMGIDEPAQAAEPEHTPETLETLTALDGPPEGSVGAETITADILARQGFGARLPEDDVQGRLDQIRASFMALTHETPVSDPPAASVVSEPTELDGVKVERVVVRSEQDVDVPVVVLIGVGERDEGSAAGVVLVDAEGKANLLTSRWSLVLQLVKAGLVVAVPDVRPFGELSLNRAPQDMNGVVFGRPELAVAAHDVTQVAAYLRGREDVDGSRVGCVGFSDGAVVAIAAGVYDRALSPVVALDIGPAYSAADRTPRCPRVLTVADIPQLAATLAPRAVWLQGASDADAVGWTVAAYQRLGVSGLTVTSPAVEDAELVEFLK